MAERTQFPSTPACGAWETLLADALDGLLMPEDEAQFLAHKAICPACTALYEEARKGREWLEFLSPEPEVPEGLLDRILAQHGSGALAKLADAGSGRFKNGSGICAAGMAAAGIRCSDAVCVAAAAGDDGCDGVLLDRADVEPGRSAVVYAAAGRIAAESGALVHGAADQHGLGADREVLRPSAVCVRSGIESAANAQPEQ